MSRIGKKPILVPSGATVTVSGNLVTLKGPKGELKGELHPDVAAEVKGSEIVISPKRKAKRVFALWGLMRSLVANMVEGVTSGFEKKLEFEGIGFRANVEGSVLVFQLGFSHPVRFEAPEGIKFAVEKNTITVSGIDKWLVGETTARIRALKPPEPYKGKGIRHQGEVIRRKAGKKAVASA
jgi:large subunit ribosomal protein L6